jgi:hypothetical protein
MITYFPKKEIIFILHYFFLLGCHPSLSYVIISHLIQICLGIKNTLVTLHLFLSFLSKMCVSDVFWTFFPNKEGISIMGLAYPEWQDNSASNETKKIAFLGNFF